MDKNFVSVEVDSDAQLLLNKENYDLFVKFDDELREKIISTASALLKENLFDYTFMTDSNSRYYLSFDFWRSASDSDFHIDFFTKEKIYLTLTKWGRYGGDDETTNCSFDSNLLFSNRDDDVWKSAIKRRDENLIKHKKQIEDDLESKKNLQLEQKRKLFEQLKEELGEV